MTLADPPPEGTPRARVGAAWSRIGLGIAASLLVQLVVRLVEASPDEAGWLRWLRVVAEHPVRCAAAAALVACALGPRSPPDPPPRPPEGPPTTPA